MRLWICIDFDQQLFQDFIRERYIRQQKIKHFVHASVFGKWHLISKSCRDRIIWVTKMFSRFFFFFLKIAFYIDRSIDVCGCKLITDESVNRLAMNCRQLVYLDISSTGCTYKRWDFSLWHLLVTLRLVFLITSLNVLMRTF